MNISCFQMSDHGNLVGLSESMYVRIELCLDNAVMQLHASIQKVEIRNAMILK